MLFCFLFILVVRLSSLVLHKRNKYRSVNKLQKRCIRILTFSDFNSHTIDLSAKLKMLKAQNIFTLNKLIFMIDYIKSSIPDELKRLFTFIYDIHSYITHSSEVFHIPKRNTTLTALNYGTSFILNC